MRGIPGGVHYGMLQTHKAETGGCTVSVCTLWSWDLASSQEAADPGRPTPAPAPPAQLVRVGRTRFPLSALQAGTMRGIIAWSTKLHFLGRVAGLAEAAEAAGLHGGSVPLDCARMLSAALRHRHTDRALGDA